MSILSLGLISVIGMGNLAYSMILTNAIHDSCQIAGLSYATTAVALLSTFVMAGALILLVCVKKMEKCNIKDKTKQFLVLGVGLTAILLMLSGAVMYEIEKVPSTCQISKIPVISAIAGNFIAVALLMLLYKKVE